MERSERVAGAALGVVLLVSTLTAAGCSSSGSAIPPSPGVAACHALVRSEAGLASRMSAQYILSELTLIRREHAEAIASDSELRSDFEAAIGEAQMIIEANGGSATAFTQLLEHCVDMTAVDTTTTR